MTEPTYHPRYEESPAVLEDGRWVRRGLVMTWEPTDADAEPEPTEVRPTRIVDLIACLSCGARMAERCKTTSGAWAKDSHIGRLAKRVCECGNDLAKGCEWCTPCRREHDLQRKRDYRERLREGVVKAHEIDELVVERILDGEKVSATKAERFEVLARWMGSDNELVKVTGWNVPRMRREMQGEVAA